MKKETEKKKNPYFSHNLPLEKVRLVNLAAY